MQWIKQSGNIWSCGWNADSPQSSCCGLVQPTGVVCASDLTEFDQLREASWRLVEGCCTLPDVCGGVCDRYFTIGYKKDV